MDKNAADENGPWEEDEISSSEQSVSDKQPLLSIQLYSWAIPIVGLVMLVIGLLGGYFLRPLVASEKETSSAPAPPRSTEQAAAPNSPDTSQMQAPNQDALKMMEYLVSETRHFIGDPDAPVVMIEFSDFQ